MPRGTDQTSERAAKYSCRSVCRGASRTGNRFVGTNFYAGEVFQPIRLAAEIQPSLNGVIHTWSRFVRFACQYHPRILQALAALAMVARLTAGNYVRPLVASPATARHDMIDSHIFIHTSTVLTCEAISNENLPPRELDSRSGPTHKCPQSDD